MIGNKYVTNNSGNDIRAVAVRVSPVVLTTLFYQMLSNTNTSLLSQAKSKAGINEREEG